MQRAGNTVRLPEREGGESVQAGAEAQFGDVKAIAEACGKVIAVEKNVGRLGKPIVQRIVGVVEGARDRHVASPLQIGMVFLHALAYLR